MYDKPFQIHNKNKKIDLTSNRGNSRSDTSNITSSSYINDQYNGLKPGINDVEVTFVDFVDIGLRIIL